MSTGRWIFLIEILESYLPRTSRWKGVKGKATFAMSDMDENGATSTKAKGSLLAANSTATAAPRDRPK